ncbi:WD repeat-containing protein 78, partial [Nowakowskiella sp. JEL0078]
MNKAKKGTKSSKTNNFNDSIGTNLKSKNTLTGSGVGSVDASSSKIMHHPRSKSIAGNASGISIGVSDRTTSALLLDEDGNDVTPISLMSPHRMPHGKFSGVISNTEVSLLEGVQKESVTDVLNNFESMTLGSFLISNGESILTSGTSSMDGENLSTNGSDDSVDERDDGIVSKETKMESEAEQRGLSEIELMSLIHLNLQETETILLYDMSSISVSNEFSEEVLAVKVSNSKYKELKSSRINNDNFVDRGMQTFNDPCKNKEVQAFGAKSTNSECMATSWSIYDAQQSKKSSANGEKEDFDDQQKLDDIGNTMPADDIGDTENSPQNANAYMNDDSTAYEMVPESADAAGVPGGEQNGGLVSRLDQEALRSSLVIMERAVVANNYLKKLLVYRDILEIEEVLHVHENDEELFEEDADDLYDV